MLKMRVCISRWALADCFVQTRAEPDAGAMRLMSAWFLVFESLRRATPKHETTDNPKYSSNYLISVQIYRVSFKDPKGGKMCSFKFPTFDKPREFSISQEAIHATTHGHFSALTSLPRNKPGESEKNVALTSRLGTFPTILNPRPNRRNFRDLIF